MYFKLLSVGMKIVVLTGKPDTWLYGQDRETTETSQK